MRRFSGDNCDARTRAGSFHDFTRCVAMIRSMALVIVLSLLSPLSALAAGEPANVSAAFGNTLVTVDPDGRTRQIWLKPDGTWSGRSRRGLALAGKWTVKGDRVCLTQSKPHLIGSMCETVPRLGAADEAGDPAGNKVRLKLVRGQAGK